jgi:hypothetical protein
MLKLVSADKGNMIPLVVTCAAAAGLVAWYKVLIPLNRVIELSEELTGQVEIPSSVQPRTTDEKVHGGILSLAGCGK